MPTKILKRRVHSQCLFCGRPKIGRHCRPCNRGFRNVQIQIDKMFDGWEYEAAPEEKCEP